jgi:hypothetical protein
VTDISPNRGTPTPRQPTHLKVCVGVVGVRSAFALPDKTDLSVSVGFVGVILPGAFMAGNLTPTHSPADRSDASATERTPPPCIRRLARRDTDCVSVV